jgi:hypothetical protein
MDRSHIVDHWAPICDHKTVLPLNSCRRSSRSQWLVILLIGSGCSLKSLLPGTPVLSNAELASFDHNETSAASYTGTARVPFPVLPLQGFGLQYAADIVFVTQHADWDMHEYARLDTPKGSVWIAKDSNMDGQQTIVSDLPNLKSWLPEIPAPRVEADIELTDRSEENAIDISLAYTNPAGIPVRVTAQGVIPDKPPTKRNGNTMGHSRDVVAAVLDIERFGSKVNGTMEIDGEPQTFTKILGLKPFRFLLKQTQSGIAVTNFRQRASPSGFTLIRPSPADPTWPTDGNETWIVDGDSVTWDNGICTYTNTFNDGGLQHLQVRQHGVDNPTLTMYIEPALPDLRRQFEGVIRSQFRMDVNGQKGHGRGYIDARWNNDGTAQVTMIPTQPRWLADRPMKTVITYQEGGEVDVRTKRIEPAPR